MSDILDVVGLTERRGADPPFERRPGNREPRQRAGRRPSLLFLDEVTSGLDEKTDREVMELFRQVADGGKTVVCITHSLANVEATCHLVVILTEGGRLASSARPMRRKHISTSPGWETSTGPSPRGPPGSGTTCSERASSTGCTWPTGCRPWEFQAAARCDAPGRLSARADGSSPGSGVNSGDTSRSGVATARLLLALLGQTPWSPSFSGWCSTTWRSVQPGRTGAEDDQPLDDAGRIVLLVGGDLATGSCYRLGDCVRLR